MNDNTYIFRIDLLNRNSKSSFSYKIDELDKKIIAI